MTLNGQVAPTIDIRPGEAQLWRVANIGADLFLELDLGGVRAFTVATDGHPLERPAPCGRVLLGPGQRVELVVVGPPPGRYPFRSVPLVLEEGKPPLPEHLLGTVVSAGPPGDADAVARRIEAARAPPSPALVALRDAPVTARRAFVFTRSMDRMRFYINGKLFGEAASRSGPSATRTTSSTTSTSTETAFLVTESGGVPLPPDRLLDTVTVPSEVRGVPGSIRLKVAFTDPLIVGRFVFHCHVAKHEDKGMMQTIEVEPARHP